MVEPIGALSEIGTVGLPHVGRVHPEFGAFRVAVAPPVGHRHILDTAAYREDCEAIFGRFLDHFPYFGLRGDADAEALTDAYVEPLQRYRLAFGEPPEGTWISDDASR
jgi:hypothetical protein